MHDIPSLFNQNTKKKHVQYLHLQELATLFLAYVRARSTNEPPNKQTNNQTNKQRNREKTENVASPFIRPPSLLNYRRAMDVNKCKFFKDKNFVFSTTVIS